MTWNETECPIQIKVRFTEGTLDIYVCCGFRSWLCVTEWAWPLLSAIKMRPMNCDFRAW